jgi:broad specificity phosphatase PhoE
VLTMSRSDRYPRGESYVDLIHRLEKVIFELERARCPIVVVAHQAVLRCLLAYFMSIPMDKIPYIPMPLHRLVELRPGVRGCEAIEVRVVSVSVTSQRMCLMWPIVFVNLALSPLTAML